MESGHPGSEVESALGAGANVEVEVEAGPPTALGMDDLQQRAARLERAARELAGAARELLRDAREPRTSDDADRDPHGNPLREGELAAVCRAAGLYERAVHHSVRGARILAAAGCQREARDILEEGGADPSAQTVDSLELLSRAWSELGAPERAGEAALLAAERRRMAGQHDRAVALCERAAALDPEAPELHRTWGLALLARGDAASALGHLLCWRATARDDLAPHVWTVQAWTELEDERSAREALRELARRAGLRRYRHLPIEGMAERVHAHLRRTPDAGRPRPATPFWERPELVGKPDQEADDALEVRVTEHTEPDARSAATTPPRRPRVFISLDTEFHRVRLSEILGSEGIDVLRCSAVESALDRLAREVLPVDLLLLSIPRGPRADLRFLRQIREVPALESVPILCVTTLDRSGLDFDELRRLGVVGLIDKNALPEEIVFRVNSVVWGRRGPVRRHSRAPVFLAVDVEADGRSTSEYASTLGCGGMGLVSQRPLEPNGDLTARFRLPDDPDDELIEARGKVLYCKPFRRKGEQLYRVGVFFYPLDPRPQRRVETAVRRILDETGF